MAELAQLLGRHRDLVRPAPREDGDRSDAWPRERVERVADDVRSGELVGRLGEDPRDVERDIARADHHRAGTVERRGEVGEIGMAVIPADERRRADHAGQVVAGDAERPVGGRAGREHHRVVQAEQFVDRHVAADRDIADEAHIVAERGRLVAAC